MDGSDGDHEKAKGRRMAKEKFVKLCPFEHNLRYPPTHIPNTSLEQSHNHPLIPHATTLLRLPVLPLLRLPVLSLLRLPVLSLLGLSILLLRRLPVPLLRVLRLLPVSLLRMLRLSITLLRLSSRRSISRLTIRRRGMRTWCRGAGLISSLLWLRVSALLRRGTSVPHTNVCVAFVGEGLWMVGVRAWED